MKSAPRGKRGKKAVCQYPIRPPPIRKSSLSHHNLSPQIDRLDKSFNILISNLFALSSFYSVVVHPADPGGVGRGRLRRGPGPGGLLRAARGGQGGWRRRQQEEAHLRREGQARHRLGVCARCVAGRSGGGNGGIRRRVRVPPLQGKLFTPPQSCSWYGTIFV